MDPQMEDGRKAVYRPRYREEEKAQNALIVANPDLLCKSGGGDKAYH